MERAVFSDTTATSVRQMPPLDRRIIERQIEQLIELLDQIDGDPDLEDDDPDGDPCDFGEDDGLSPVRPLYAVDQTTGPLNVEEAMEAAFNRVA